MTPPHGPPTRPTMKPRHLVAGFLTLLQTLAALTSAELKANFGALRLPMAMVAAAGGLLMIAMTLALVAGVLALAQLVGATAATAIVAAIAAVVGLALGWTGLSRLEQIDLAPRRSITALQAQIDRFSDLTKNEEETAKDRNND